MNDKLNKILIIKKYIYILNMSFLSKELELINFIDSKISKKNSLDYNTILFYFCKVIKEAILKSYERLKDLIWIQECSSIVFNIFWQILSYTYNVKLAMFLCERAILLFNEYIDLAKNTFKDNNNDFKINSTDVKLFIYKRTIGPIKIKQNKSKYFNKLISNIKYASIKLKNLLLNISIEIINNDNKNELEKTLEYIENLLPDIYHKLFVNNIYVDNSDYIAELNNNNKIVILNKLKLDLELYYFIYKKTNKNNNLKFLKEIFNKLIYENEYEDIKIEMFKKNNYNSLKKKYLIKKKKKFKKLINNKL